MSSITRNPNPRPVWTPPPNGGDRFGSQSDSKWRHVTPPRPTFNDGWRVVDYEVRGEPSTSVEREGEGGARETDIVDSSISDDEQQSQHNYVVNVEDEDVASSADESDDPEFQELQERATIVEKYEKGPEQVVEEWENPDFELYKVTDRYGFVHKNGTLLSAAETAEKKKAAKEASRERKWLRMISQWSSGQRVEKFHERVWKGVPEKLRSVVWAQLLEVGRYQRESTGNIYRELLMRARLVSKDIKQIDLDINRTYRDHMAFRRRYDVKQQSLFNVLAAYAMYNTEVGYCQGMSQIAALFLMYMDEEEAFWCLHSLLVDKRHAMHGFFVPGFPKLLRFQAHYEKVLQKYLPRIKKHLDKAGIPPIYLTKWWFGCFLDRIPFSYALRLWDVFLLEGDMILIAMAYNIMKMHQKAIRKLQIENFMEYIQTTIAQDFGFSEEETFRSLDECVRKLRSDRMGLPPPPKAGDPPETPTKPLGPVLTRSMIDIRCDIDEIQSRCSRANSVAGRSPRVARRPRMPPSPTPMRTKLEASPPAAVPKSSTVAPVIPERKELSPSSVSPSGSSNSTVRGGGSSELKPERGEVVTPISAVDVPLPTSNDVERSSVSPRRTNETKPAERFPPKSESMNAVSTAPSKIVRDSSLKNRRPVPSTIEEGVPSPPLAIEHSRKEPFGSSSVVRVSSPADRAQAERSTPGVPPSYESRRLRVGGATMDISFPDSSIPSRLPPEPPIDYEDREETSRYRGGVDMRPITSTKPFDSYKGTHPRGEAIPRHEPDYKDASARRNRPAPLMFPRADSPLYDGRTQKRSPNESQIPVSVMKSERKSFYDNVPSRSQFSPMSEQMKKGKVVGNDGELVYESRTEDRSMERRFRNEQNSPTLLESRRQQTVTEVETRVIQLPNYVTYVSVGEESASDPRKITSTHRFPAHRDTPRHEPMVSSPPRYMERLPRSYALGEHDRWRSSSAGIGGGTVGPFQSHFRNEVPSSGSRPVYYASQRNYPSEDRRPISPRMLPSRPNDSRFVYPSNPRSNKYSVV